MGLAKGSLRLRREPKATNDALIRPDSIDLLATGQPWASAVRRFAPPRTRRDPRPYLKASRFAIAPNGKAGSIRLNPRGRDPAQNPRHPPLTKRHSD